MDKNNGVSPEAILEANRLRYAGKVTDLYDFKKELDPAFYYEECFEIGIKRTQDKINSNFIERHLTATMLRNDIISIGQNIMNCITYKGCKQIMSICCEIMSLSNIIAFRDQMLNEIIYTNVMNILSINLNCISSNASTEATFYGSKYNSEDYFNAIDLLINLYFAFGKKDFLNSSMNLIEEFSKLMVSKECKLRAQSYIDFIKEELDKTWIPPQGYNNCLFDDSKQQTSQKKSEGCFIATAVYGSYDSEPVLVLRKFRDQFLLKTKMGKRFVQLYYERSPELVRRYCSNKTITIVVRIILNIIVMLLRPFVNKYKL